MILQSNTKKWMKEKKKICHSSTQYVYSKNKSSDISIGDMCKYDNCSKNSMMQSVNINYSDMQSMINDFSAEKFENVIFWVENFENVSDLFNLTDIQKFIFAKRSLKGNALLFVRTEPEINSWQKLKQSLIDEFSFEINSANLHEMLNKRKMKDTETIQEYFLKMKELGKHGKIEDSALMHYIIKGINDKTESKTILYGCKNLLEFKEKLKVYEVMKNDSDRGRSVCDKIKTKHDFNERFYSYDKVKSKVDYNDRFNSKIENVNRSKVRYDSDFENMKYYNKPENHSDKFCYNCGMRGHVGKNCVDREKGVKCFKCSKYGHISRECSSVDTKPEVATLNVGTESKLTKMVEIGNLSVNSLIDTGSQVTLMRKAVYDKLDVKKLFPYDSILRGVEHCRIKPLGYFKDNIQIDNFKCYADVCVVENNVMTYDVIIGLNVLMQGETIINENGITIKNKSPCVEEVNFVSVLPIDLASSEAVVINDEPIFHQSSMLPFSETFENIDEKFSVYDTESKTSSSDNNKMTIDDLKVVDLKNELEKRDLDKNGVISLLIEKLKYAIIEEGKKPLEHAFDAASATTTHLKCNEVESLPFAVSVDTNDKFAVQEEKPDATLQSVDEEVVQPKEEKSIIELLKSLSATEKKLLKKLFKQEETSNCKKKKNKRKKSRKSRSNYPKKKSEKPKECEPTDDPCSDSSKEDRVDEETNTSSDAKLKNFKSPYFDYFKDDSRVSKSDSKSKRKKKTKEFKPKKRKKHKYAIP